MDLETLQITVVGKGRMGTALAAAMRAAGLRIAGPLGRGERGEGADLVVLCVPDRSIAEAARVVVPGRLVAHCSGASTLAPLAPHEALSIHPLVTVTGDSRTSLTGVGCAVAGSTERARALATTLAERLGMRPVYVGDADRDLYHAAASLASNYLTALEGAAERLFSLVGVERPLVVPLVRAAVDNWGTLGAERALTGPIARGDTETVARQRAAVASRAPDLLPLWDSLAEATHALAERQRALATPS